MKRQAVKDPSLIQLVNHLLARKTLKVKTIKETLGCEDATAYRKFAALARLEGVAIGREGIEKTLRLGRSSDGSRRINGLEVCALVLASSITRAIRPVQLSTYLQTLTRDLVAESKEFAHATHLDRKFWLVTRGGDAALRKPAAQDQLLEILHAILLEKSVSFAYTHGSGAENHVKVDPLTLVYHDQQFYVLSRKDDGGFHPFRLSRMHAVREGARFEYPSQAEYDPEQFFRDAFGIFVDSEEPVQKVVLRLRDAFWVRYAEQHRWHESQRIVPNADESVDVVIRARICPELERWVLWFGAAAEVIEPASLRDHVVDQARRVLAQYGEGAPGVKSAHPRRAKPVATSARPAANRPRKSAR